jgi:hypothetical protein
VDRLVDVGLAGLVFLGLIFWLLRKVMRAARTESDLEGERLTGAFAEELRAAKALAKGEAAPGPRMAVVPPPEVPLGPLASADVRGATEEHLRVIETLALEREQILRSGHKGPSDVPRRVEVLWAKSTATHAVWCERRYAATLAAAAMNRDVICVVRIEDGRPGERWSY